MKKYVVSNIRVNLNDANNKYFHHFQEYESSNTFRNESHKKFLDEKKELKANAEDVQERYQRYVLILANRLNKLHKTNFSNEFYLRLFSLGLFRYISNLHMFFKRIEENFNLKQHTCEILSIKNFVYPQHFEDQRELLTSSWVGQEQLFSIYIDYFYKNQYLRFDYVQPEDKFLKIPYGGVLVYLKKIKKIFNAEELRCFIRYKWFQISTPKSNVRVGIVGSFFSASYMNKIIEEAGGNLLPIELCDLPRSSHLDEKMRCQLSFIENGMDRFDEFFFQSLQYLMPRFLLEDFKSSIEIYKKQLSIFQQLEFIVSEAWLSSSSINLFRALAFESSGVQTLYNEHNCILHTFVGSTVELESRLVDRYLTLGWRGESPKFIPLGSLYPFNLKSKNKIKRNIKYPILYVSYPVEQVMAIYSSAYSNAGYGALEHLEFVESFFKNLHFDVLKKINYRGYPKDYFISGLRYDKESILKEYLQHVAVVSSFKYKGETCKQQMQVAGIVVIDFLSTAYLEALMMNIPTICFWDPAVMTLKDEYLDFYNDLIDAKIIHTNPESAGKHLLNVYQDPLVWWNSLETQKLKNDWLSKHFGSPQLLINYLKNIALK